MLTWAQATTRRPVPAASCWAVIAFVYEKLLCIGMWKIRECARGAMGIHAPCFLLTASKVKWISLKWIARLFCQSVGVSLLQFHFLGLARLQTGAHADGCVVRRVELVPADLRQEAEGSPLNSKH